MLEKITEEELSAVECLYNPVCLTECLFSDLENCNLARFEEDKFSHVRLYQYPMLSFEYLVDSEQHNLSPLFDENKKLNFKLRERSGSVISFGARRYGKTLVTEQIDLILDMILNNGENIGFTSYDARHIESIMEVEIQAFENHPFLKVFDSRVKRNPYYIYLKKNGSRVLGINMNLQGSTPGSGFYQQHFNRLYIEEASQEIQEVYDKRLDAVSENGCVLRTSGMTDFTRYKPAGKTFYDLANKNLIVNYPQFVSPKWDEKEKEKAIKERGGEDSASYKVFVLGEVIEDAVSVMDMDRVRNNYNPKKILKTFEIDKDKFYNFESILILERIKNADYLYIAADIGESAPTEIIVLQEVDKCFKYTHNITLHNLIDKEQFKIFKYLAFLLEANFIGLDTTEGTSRAIFRSLEEIIPKEHLSWVHFAEKIPVEVEKDNNGNIIFEDGKMVYKEEYVEAWSIKRLKDLLYEPGRVEIPANDFKLDQQLNSIVAIQSGNRTTYQAICQEDHLLAAWRVFAISQWQNEFVNTPKIIKKEFSKIGI
jgi:hypothetical protein